MSVRPTSIRAYNEIKADGTLSFQEQLIFSYIERNPKKTRKQIARALEIDVSSVAARANKLLEKRLITDATKGKCPLSGKTVGLLEVM